MRLDERRYARVPAAVCLGIALLTGGAFAQEQKLPLKSAVSVANPAETGAVRKKTIADIPIWKRITVGTQKNVNAMREALEGAHAHWRLGG